MFTGFYNKKIYQFNYYKAIHEISALRNYKAIVSGKHGSLYHHSIQEVYLSIKTKSLYKLHKRGKCNFMQPPNNETAKKFIKSSELTAAPIK